VRKSRWHSMANKDITLKLYASLAEFLPPSAKDNKAVITVEPDETVSDLIKRFHLPERLVHLVLINGVYIEPEERAKRYLKSGEVLAIWPPVAGG